MEKQDVEKLGFNYYQTDYRFVARWKDGSWNNGELSNNPNVVLNESACVFQYAQTVFEGLKAYKTKNGHIVCFRPDLNADRMIDSCERMIMPPFPKEAFLKAVDEVVLANEAFIPEYGSGGALYLRPFMMGISPALGVRPAVEYEFRLFASPVGSYFKGGVKPLHVKISDYDRAAPHGTGHIKAGLNYALSMYPYKIAHDEGFDENIYLDSATRTYIEETGGANILFVTHDNKIITPKSDTILPSITKRSILAVAKDYLGIEVIERPVRFDELDTFKECGLCGTAAVISPIGAIYDGTKDITFESTDVLMKIRELLTGIQQEDIEGPEGWVRIIK